MKDQLKEYFSDFRGWLALGVFTVALLIMGFTKILSRHTNLAIVLIFVVAVIDMCILGLKPRKTEEEKPAEKNNEE